MKQRVTSSIAEADGLWSYSVKVDDQEVASGSGYTAVPTMRAHIDRDMEAARRNLELEEVARRYAAERRSVVVLLAPTVELAATAAQLVRVLLKVPAHIEVAPMAPFSQLPEGVHPVGLCVLGVDFSDADVHRWTLDHLVSQIGRGAVFLGIESDIDDIVPAGGRRVFPFLNL